MYKIKMDWLWIATEKNDNLFFLMLLFFYFYLDAAQMCDFFPAPYFWLDIPFVPNIFT